MHTMTLEPVQYLAGALSGGLVGGMLRLVGGGGSILAVPLMIYVVGIQDIHVAIGTSTVAVAVNAAASLASHARAANVKWRCGGFFAAAGTLGALCGSVVGKAGGWSKPPAVWGVAGRCSQPYSPW